MHRTGLATTSRASDTVKFAITGACGGYARTLLAQARYVPGLTCSVVCDLDVAGATRLLDELGYQDHCHCQTSPAVAVAVASGRLAVVSDASIIPPASYEVMVEATGNPIFGYTVARQALEADRHVVMVSKEVDSVAGPALHALASEHGVVYTPPAGDQPGNLIQLVEWLRLLGLELVAVGKASEYDLIWNPEDKTITQFDKTISAPEFAEIFTMGADITATLQQRAAAVAELGRDATADFCELSVVAAYTGFRADRELLHYPVARTAELADIYALEQDGGILSSTGVVEVFRALRSTHEASFAGGVFAVVRTHDRYSWELLRSKGHLISKNGAYACIYLPYHLMGIETPTTILAAARLGVGVGTGQPHGRTVLAGRAKTDLSAGTRLVMGGHHHDVAGVQAVLIDRAERPDMAPLYLAANQLLNDDVAAGELICLADIATPDARLLDAWQVGSAQLGD